jgi:hypothetical protein
MVHFNCKLSHPISCITLKSSLSCISPTPFLSLLVEFDLLLIFNILVYCSLISYVTCLLSRVSECGHEGGSPMTSSRDVTFAAGPAPAKRSWPRAGGWETREVGGAGVCRRGPTCPMRKWLLTSPVVLVVVACVAGWVTEEKIWKYLNCYLYNRRGHRNKFEA